MPTPVSSIPNGDLLTPFINQSQSATAAAKEQMAANVTNGTNAATTGLAGNFNTFLKILITQLAHQDPTAPVDANQFTQELVQFSGVEQQLNTNKLLQQIIGLQSGGSLAANLNYIGNYVEAMSASNEFVVQDGVAEFGYGLTGAASDVTIKVLNADGATVATLKGPGAAGSNYVSWDGKDDGGTQLPDGIYKFQIAAKDNAGATVMVSGALTIAKVTALKTGSDGLTQLICGGLAVANSDVDAVYQPGALPAAVPLTPTGI